METEEFIDLAQFSPADRSAIVARVTSPSAPLVFSLSAQHCSEFQWNGNVLGEYNPDREDAVKKGVRYMPYALMEPLSFNSSTLSVPRRGAARAAYAISELLQQYLASQHMHRAEALIAQVARKGFEQLCAHYFLPTAESEVLFDDNASMAIFQLLGLLNLPQLASIVTFFDTGRVMPEALTGTNPEALPFNFKPAVDVFNNFRATSNQQVKLGSFDLSLIEHYTNRYRSNDEILNEILGIVERKKPALVVIPTVTRLGRRLPFIKMCEVIRTRANELGYTPLLILDDCQGIGRLEHTRYIIRDDGIKLTSIWQYADGIMLTGAKVLGALMGSGAVLLRKSVIQERQIPFSRSPLLYRARQYGFISDDPIRIHDYNESAPRIAQAPEISSLTIALQNIPAPEEVYMVMQLVRTWIVARLKDIPGLLVLEPEGADAQFVDSIIGFYLTSHPHQGGKLKDLLAQPRTGTGRFDSLPITLPALISADNREYLRIALDPKRVVSDIDYLVKIDYVLGCLAKIVREHFATP